MNSGTSTQRACGGGWRVIENGTVPLRDRLVEVRSDSDACYEDGNMFWPLLFKDRTENLLSVLVLTIGISSLVCHFVRVVYLIVPTVIAHNNK